MTFIEELEPKTLQAQFLGDPAASEQGNKNEEDDIQRKEENSRGDDDSRFVFSGEHIKLERPDKSFTDMEWNLLQQIEEDHETILPSVVNKQTPKEIRERQLQIKLLSSSGSGQRSR